MTFTYFCRQLNDSGTWMGEPWGNEDLTALIVSEVNMNIEVLLEPGPDQGFGGCFGTGYGTIIP